MKLRIVHLWILCSLFLMETVWSQVRAGSPESRLFEQISAESNPEPKLALIESFGRQFPDSKILDKVYLAAIEVFRDGGDREKMIEYGEKVLKLDDANVTALMLLARNYSIESKSLDRAVELAQRAVDRVEKWKTDVMPYGYTDTQWKSYLQTSEQSAKQILEYAKAMKARSEKMAGKS